MAVCRPASRAAGVTEPMAPCGRTSSEWATKSATGRRAPSGGGGARTRMQSPLRVLNRRPLLPLLCGERGEARAWGMPATRMNSLQSFGDVDFLPFVADFPGNEVAAATIGDGAGGWKAPAMLG